MSAINKLTALIVEDEDKIREIQSRYFKQAGFDVVGVADGSEALTYFNQQEIDIVILDLNLPILDGISVCRSIRKKSSVPIIMVTAKSSEVDELNGLDVGADDYITKPFSPKVLVTRAEKLLGRSTSNPQEIFSIGNVELNLSKRQVTKKGKVIHLTPTQLSLLIYMNKNIGTALSRDQLIEKGYGKADLPDVFDRTIDSHIKDLRKVVEDDPKNPRFILTVRGYGYRLNDEI